MLIRERLYDSAAFFVSPSSVQESGEYAEPHPELTFEKFVTPLLARTASAAHRA